MIKMLKLDTILLFALLIPFVMGYRISPSETPYWLFGLIFLGLLSYLSLDLFFKLKIALRNRLKLFLLSFLIILSIGSAMYSAIVVRHQVSPIYNVHDIIIQQESAIRFLLHGRNPYSTTYFDTPLSQWHYSDTEINPALYHFVMEPFYLIFAIPFYFPIAHTVGFFDARIPLMFLFIAILAMAASLVKDPENKRLFIVLLAFSPATLGYFLEGRDDFFMYAFLFASLFLLHKNKNILSSLSLGLAFAVKQSVWPIFPFYFAYIFYKNKNFRKTAKFFLPFSITFLVIVLPFFFWDPKAFLDSTILYLSGNTAHSYPIAGYGFGKLLNQWGVIKDVNAYYPFWIWQLIFGLPVLVGLILWQRRNNSVQRLLISYGIFLFVFWYFSRYLNNSHVGFLSLVFLTSYFWPEAKEA